MIAPKKIALGVAAFVYLGAIALGEPFSTKRIFDKSEIQNPDTLDAKTTVEWHPVPGESSLKRKLVEIAVCEWWPGQPARVPVTFVVPADGGPVENVLLINMPLSLKPAKPSGPALALAKEKGVGLIMVGMGVIEGMQPIGELHLRMRERMLATQNVRYTPAWIWGMSQMRGLTAALQESERYQPKKVIASGGSKRGIGSAAAGIFDDRFTGIFPIVAPPLGNPGGSFIIGTEEDEAIGRINERFYRELEVGALGLNPEIAVALKNRSERRELTRITVEQARAAGWSQSDMRRANDAVWDLSRITGNLARAKRKGLDYFYMLGTNDSVTPDLLKLGRNWPEFPLCIIPGGQHGGPGGADYTRRVTVQEETLANLETFARYHFFGERSALRGPRIEREWSAEDRRLTVTARFSEGQDPEANELWWSVDKSCPHTLYFEYDTWESTPMKRLGNGLFEATIAVPESARRVDFVSTQKHTENNLPWHASSPYLRFAP